MKWKPNIFKPSTMRPWGSICSDQVQFISVQLSSTTCRVEPKGLFTPSGNTSESEKYQRTSKRDQSINGKHQKKISFSRSLSLGSEHSLSNQDNKAFTRAGTICLPNQCGHLNKVDRINKYWVYLSEIWPKIISLVTGSYCVPSLINFFFQE